MLLSGETMNETRSDLVKPETGCLCAVWRDVGLLTEWIWGDGLSAAGENGGFSGFDKGCWVCFPFFSFSFFSSSSSKKG